MSAISLLNFKLIDGDHLLAIFDILILDFAEKTETYLGIPKKITKLIVFWWSFALLGSIEYQKIFNFPKTNNT